MNPVHISVHADVFKMETHKHSILIRSDRYNVQRAHVIITYENGKYTNHRYGEDSELDGAPQPNFPPLVKLELEGEVLELVRRKLLVDNPPVQTPPNREQP